MRPVPTNVPAAPGVVRVVVYCRVSTRTSASGSSCASAGNTARAAAGASSPCAWTAQEVAAVLRVGDHVVYRALREGAFLRCRTRGKRGHWRIVVDEHGHPVEAPESGEVV